MPILNRNQHICVQIDRPTALDHLLSKEERQPVNILLHHLKDKQFDVYAGGSVIRELLFGPDIRHRVVRFPDFDIFAVGNPRSLQFIPLDKTGGKPETLKVSTEHIRKLGAKATATTTLAAAVPKSTPKPAKPSKPAKAAKPAKVEVKTLKSAKPARAKPAAAKPAKGGAKKILKR